MHTHPFALSFLPAAAAPACAARQSLSHRQLIEVGRPLGRRVACTSGRLWLTFDGCPQDFVIEAGESLDCRERGRLLIMALQDSTVCLA